MTKVIAEGVVKGKATVITCIDKDRAVTLFQDGKELNDFDSTKFELYSYSAWRYAKASAETPHSYNPEEGTIEAYWLALHETYFDKPPKIKIEGTLDTFGSPYSDEDTSDVVFQLEVIEMANKPDLNDWMSDLLKGLIQLTFKAINQAKEKKR